MVSRPHGRRLLALVFVVASGLVAAVDEASIATFSIVAMDPATADLGVAVQSKYFAVGSVVPHARAGAGAIATQAMGNIQYGYQGLPLLADGIPAEGVLKRLLAADPRREFRQVGLVDSEGRAATFTGARTLPWSGGKTGSHYAVQGNLLAGPGVIDAMAAAFETATGDLGQRLVAALAAGQAAGGDMRGRQSAALLVVRAGAGYMGANDRLIDLHVEDHPAPIRELSRLLDLRRGQLALAASLEALEAAQSAADGAGVARCSLARQRAEEATRLAPAEGDGWLVLAASETRCGDPVAAAAAARRALIANPLLKLYAQHPDWAMIPGPVSLDALLALPGVGAVWEALPAQ